MANGSRPISRRLSASSSGSRSKIASRSTTSTCPVSSAAFSRMARPPSTGHVSSTTRPLSGSMSRKPRVPNEWTWSAPSRLPKPITSILSRPLSNRPRKSVCGFTRETVTTPSAARALRSHHTGWPHELVPTATASMSVSTGTPRWASSMP